MAAQGATAAAIAPRLARRPSRRRLVVAGLCAAFVLATGVAALLLDTTRSDLDLFFWPSAEIAAHGHPLLVYAVRSGLNPNDNGPLALLPLTGVAALSNLLGIATRMPLRDGLTETVFAVFSLLLAREAVLWVEAGRGRRVPRLAVGALFLALPPLWVTTIDFGHVEGPLELWLLLLGIRLVARHATLRGSVCLGLAVLTRSLALVALLPVVLSLLSGRRWRAAAGLVGGTALVTAAGIVPFLVADRTDLVYSLLTFRPTLAVAGGSLWFVFRAAPWIGVVQGSDVWFLAAAAGLLSAALLATRGAAGGGEGIAAARATPGVRGGPPLPELEVARILPLLAISSLCVPMLAKTTWPYYYLEPCVLATLWWLARPQRVVSWRVLPPALIAVGGGVLGAIEQHLPLPALPGEIAGIAASAGIAGIIALIVADAAALPGRRAVPVSPAPLDSPGC